MVRRTRALASAAALALMTALAGPVSADSLQDAIALAYETNPTLLAQRAQQRALDWAPGSAALMRPVCCWRMRGRWRTPAVRTRRGCPGC